MANAALSIQDHHRRLFPQLWRCPNNKSSANLKQCSEYFSQSGEDRALYEWYIREKSIHDTPQNPGIFLEIGALDGIKYSNTLFYEKCLNWHGILIEAHPENGRKLRLSRRTNSVKLIQGICAPPQRFIDMMGKGDAVSASVEDMDPTFKKVFHTDPQNIAIHRVNCSPLGPLLQEMAITHIDFFSLDVESAEFTVLKTLDFKKVEIHYLLVEINPGIQNVTNLLLQNDYEEINFPHCKLKSGPDCTSNKLFVQKNYRQQNFNDICLKI